MTAAAIVFLIFFVSLVFLQAVSMQRLLPWTWQTHFLFFRIGWFLWNVAIVGLVWILPTQTAWSAGWQWAGIAMAALGVGLIVWHRYLLGAERFFDAAFFGEGYTERVSGGFYRYVAHPTYDGVVLLFAGLFLWRGHFDFLTLAAVAFSLFHFFLAPMETRRLSRAR
jgi:protein-S-isoprenylcysteine O-methyltransferase Ste14